MDTAVPTAGPAGPGVPEPLPNEAPGGFRDPGVSPCMRGPAPRGAGPSPLGAQDETLGFPYRCRCGTRIFSAEMQLAHRERSKALARSCALPRISVVGLSRGPARSLQQEPEALRCASCGSIVKGELSRKTRTCAKCQRSAPSPRLRPHVDGPVRLTVRFLELLVAQGDLEFTAKEFASSRSMSLSTTYRGLHSAREAGYVTTPGSQTTLAGKTETLWRVDPAALERLRIPVPAREILVTLGP